MYYFVIKLKKFLPVDKDFFYSLEEDTWLPDIGKTTKIGNKNLAYVLQSVLNMHTLCEVQCIQLDVEF